MTCSAPCPAIDVLDEAVFTYLADDWQQLLERSYDNRVYLTATWHHLWWSYFGAGEARIFTLREEDGSLQAALPLYIASRQDERVLTLLGSTEVADYMDGLAVKQQAQKLLSQLWTCALSDLAWDRVELRHVPAASPLIPALQTAAADRQLAITVENDEVCPVAILCSNWDGYLQMLSKKQRHEIRRKLRKAQEDGKWSWRTARTVQELERDLPTFFRLHESSARAKERFMTPDMRAFFQAAAYTLLDQGLLRLSVFQRDGVDVASTMSFLYRNRWLLYNSGYDPAYAAYSPGIAAAALAMQDAIAEKAVAFDFLSGDEPYKYQFGASNTYTSRIEVTAAG